MLNSNMIPTTVVVSAAAFCMGIASDAPRAQEQQLWSTTDQVDRSLIDWQTSQRDLAGVSSSRFVTLDPTPLQSLINGPAGATATVRIDLFGTSRSVTLRRHDHQWRHHILRGSFEGREDKGDTIVFAFAERGVMAAVIELDDLRFELAYTGQGLVHGLHQFDVHATHGHSPCGLREAPAADHTTLATRNPAPPPANTSANGATTLLDVALYYTPLVRTSAGGTASIESTLLARNATANIGGANSLTAAGVSGVDFQWRVVYMAETNYVEVGDGTDLTRFRTDGDGFMDEVHPDRLVYGADQCHLITDFAASFCGIATAVNCAPANAALYAPQMFCNTIRTCLAQHSYTHELGHLTGCHHGLGSGCAAYPYAYGARTENQEYRSIMSGTPGSRLNLWSGGSIAPNGQTLGNASSDSTRALREAAPHIANYLPTTVPIPGPPVLASLSQSSQPAFNTMPVQVTISGTDLDSVNQLDVGPGQATLVSQSFSALTFTLPGGFAIGTHQVIATNFGGASNALSYAVNPTEPALLTGPGAHLPSFELDYTNWGDSSNNNCVFHMFISASNAPSALAGVVTMGIGENFNSFFLLAAIPTDTGGKANLRLFIPIGALPPLTRLYLQSIQTCDSTSLPWDDDLTNVHSVIVP